MHGDRRFALYCGSAHPPNAEGFFAMLGGGFGSLTPDQCLVIAGGVSYAIGSDERVHQSANLAPRVVLGGHVSDGCLAGLLNAAHCVILPLTQGGGTNLKTAEALWSGKFIIATTVAMRGFEQFKNSPGVLIADTARDFKNALRYAMNAKAIELGHEDRNARRVVLWEECLKGLPAYVKDVVIH